MVPAAKGLTLHQGQHTLQPASRVASAVTGVWERQEIRGRARQTQEILGRK